MPLNGPSDTTAGVFAAAGLSRRWSEFRVRVAVRATLGTDRPYVVEDGATSVTTVAVVSTVRRGPRVALGREAGLARISYGRDSMETRARGFLGVPVTLRLGDRVGLVLEMSPRVRIGGDWFPGGGKSPIGFSVGLGVSC